jgi:hypothetical protein
MNTLRNRFETDDDGNVVERKDADHILRGEYSGPRNEVEARLLRDPKEIAKSLLENFKWDDDDAEGGRHPVADFADGIRSDIEKLLDNLVQKLCKLHFEGDRFIVPVNVENYPAIDEVISGSYDSESRSLVMGIVCAAFAGLALQNDLSNDIYGELSNRINNEVFCVTSDHRKKYVVSSITLRDDPVLVSISDCSGSEETSERRMYVEVRVRFEHNEKFIEKIVPEEGQQTESQV